MRSLMFVLAAGLLAACATATPYQPGAPGSGNFGYGYQEQQIENNRVRLTFRGNSLTDRQTVETYLLYRAAELTIAQGKDYFVVSTRDTEEHTRLEGDGPYGSPFDYWYFSPRHGWGRWYDPFWDQPQNYHEVTRYEATAEISMFNGAKPANDANAFDAHEVQSHLQGQIVRPPAS